MTSYRFHCLSEPQAFPDFELNCDDDRAALVSALQKLNGPESLEIEVSAGERHVGLVCLRMDASVQREFGRLTAA